MLPISINLDKINLLLIGSIDGVEKRKNKLLELGLKNFVEIVPYKEIDEEYAKNFQLILAVGLNLEQSEQLAKIAKKNNILINIEDSNQYCDFFYSSYVKRGDLIIAVNSCGKSPTLAKRVRSYIAKMFEPIWADRLEEIASKRLLWRSKGLSNEEVAIKTDEIIDKNGWLKHD